MSKIISHDNKATAWLIPEISDLSTQNEANSPGGISRSGSNAGDEQTRKTKQAAYQEGFEQGERDGLAAAQIHINQAVQSLKSVFDSMGEPLKQVDDKIESELVNLAVSIAKQIVRRELKTDPGEVVAVVREALANIPASSQRVRVYLNPEDGELVRQIIPPNAAERTWEVIDDPVLSRGSCRVETDTTVIDASFESRIAAIAAKILGSEREND